MAQPNRVALALASIFGGAAGGAAIGTVGTYLANWMNLNGKMWFGDPRNVVFGGVGIGIAVAIYLGWSMSEGLHETWRRAAIGFTAGVGALVGGMGAFPLSMLSIMMMSQMAQLIVPGYFALMVVIWVVCTRIARKQRHLAAAPPVAA
jgi:hypothetical protein